MLPNMTYRCIDTCCRVSNHSLPQLAFFSIGRGRVTTFLAQVFHRDPIPSRPRRLIDHWGLHTARPFTSSRSMESDISETSRHDTEDGPPQQRRWASATMRTKSTTEMQTSVKISESGTPYAKFIKTKKLTTTIKIQPSYSEKPTAVENLIKGLQELLLRPHDALISGFGSAFWYIDETGLAIHRHFVVKSEKEMQNILNQIQAAANEMNHHPHIAVADGHMLTITCSTHVPPGLSMRDVKLAKKIDELMEGKIELGSAPKPLQSHELKDVIHNRKFAEEKNMAEVHRAHERGSCGTEPSPHADQSSNPAAVAN